MDKTTFWKKFQPQLMFFFLGTFVSAAQCPTVNQAVQSFCNSEQPTVLNLSAIENGNGIQWYSSPTSTTPLIETELLLDGETYYADDSSGTCGTRESVQVTIYPEPTGQNFQGVCVDSPGEATIADLIAIGNNIQWYDSPSGGTPLAPTTVLSDVTLYYASQTNPDTGCETTRFAVMALVGIVPPPDGDPVQNICYDPSNPPTLASLEIEGADNWYLTNEASNPISPATVPEDGQSYYATRVDPPCESTRFEVTVYLETLPSTGNDAFMVFCEDNVPTQDPFDLFNLLPGAAEGGNWNGPLPTTNDHLGNVDISSLGSGEYIFSYSLSIPSCSGSSSVTINITEAPNAGEPGSLVLCSPTDAPQDLFNLLEGNPDEDGYWSPELASGTGIYDPAVDTPGTYSYIVGSTSNPCPSDETTVEVSFINISAGTDATVAFCSSESPQDLFDYLGGNPDTDGTWSPALNSGTGEFDPAVDNANTYTYTVSGGNCADETATVTVDLYQEPNAGNDNSIELCSDAGPEDLFAFLGGNPDEGGTWSPTMDSGTGIFDPAVDQEGIYTYTIPATAPCQADAASITVTTHTNTVTPNAGTGPTENIFLCASEGEVDLLTYFTGNPDPNGTWSPTLASGGNYFDASYDTPGTYTYTVTTSGPCPIEASTTISIDASNCEVSIAIPSGFSPNGDGRNDEFIIPNIGERYPNYELEIYNRYGNIVFKGSSGTPNWDGSSNQSQFIGGGVLPTGVYFYIVHFNDGNTTPVQGNLYLSR